MAIYRRQIQTTLFKALICFVFMGFHQLDALAASGPPPSVTVPPVGISVSKGGIAVITLIADTSIGTTETFTWQLNGHDISTNKNVLVVSAVVPLTGIGTSTPTINNVDTTNAGVYTIKITNYGGTTTTNATLIVLDTVVSNVVNIVSTGTGMTANGFKLLLSGPTGSNCVIQASSDLNSWTSISTNTFSSGTATFTDTNAAVLPRRFYRAAIK